MEIRSQLTVDRAFQCDVENAQLSIKSMRDYRLRLSAKRLKSGKCQVKFYATLLHGKQLYGYLLVDAEESLRKVVEMIKLRLDKFKHRDTVHHINLYAIGQGNQLGENFLVFEA